MLTTKPKCRHCKKRMPDGVRWPIHEECVTPWHEANREKIARKAAAKKAKEARATTRARKAAIKTIPDLIAEAQKEFNAFIRFRDRNQPCICCGSPLGSGSVGGAYDCGHYRSRGSAPHLRFDERNANAQRKYCNRHGAGRAVDYRLGLIARLGLEAVESLEADNRVRKWTREELIAIRDDYRARLRQAMKETA